VANWLNVSIEKQVLFVILGFGRHVDYICALLGYYAGYSDYSVPTFRDNLSVPSSRVLAGPLKMGSIGCPETSVRICHCVGTVFAMDHSAAHGVLPSNKVYS
jgi:hypothetical protein